LIPAHTPIDKPMSRMRNRMSTIARRAVPSNRHNTRSGRGCRCGVACRGDRTARLRVLGMNMWTSAVNGSDG
jgi:hypothetical protein